MTSLKFLTATLESRAGGDNGIEDVCVCGGKEGTGMRWEMSVIRRQRAPANVLLRGGRRMLALAMNDECSRRFG